MASEFLVGREQKALTSPYSARDAVFAGARLDGSKVEDPDYAHCTFANVSFKDVEIVGGKFENCTFIACYFRRSIMTKVEFAACKFIDCLFPGIQLDRVLFRFPSFRGCLIEWDRLSGCWPKNPHERFLMLANLESEAERRGDLEEARTYRLAANGAWEDHLIAAFRGTERYYQEHFRSTKERKRQRNRYVRSKINRFLWGYGEQGLVLLRNFVIATCVVFPLIFFLLRHQFDVEKGTDPAAEDFLFISLSTVLPGAGSHEVVDPSVLVQAVQLAESFVGIIAAGMLIALLLKAVERR